jgi:hypothetical protein
LVFCLILRSNKKERGCEASSLFFVAIAIKLHIG